jgi:hypothetical protein
VAPALRGELELGEKTGLDDFLAARAVEELGWRIDEADRGSNIDGLVALVMASADRAWTDN